MEVELPGSNSSAAVGASVRRGKGVVDGVRMKRRSLQAILEQCQMALELFSNGQDADQSDDADDIAEFSKEERATGDDSLAGTSDRETDELCDLIRSRVGGIEFLEKLETAHLSITQGIGEESSSWDVVNENDLWDGDYLDTDMDDYVFIRQEDVVDCIASFMAACLLSLKQAKELTPNQLQEALSRTFSEKKKKGKLRKAWDGSKVIYNVASWGATAIGIYQNPVVLRAASAAFWTSCDVVSKLF